ncbi:MAG: hypothetical protein ACKO3B_00445, partial [Bacteroidota bacterium]
YTLKFISDNAGSTFESVSIPANELNGRWGVSYVYYSGTSNNVNFTVDFRSYKGNIEGVSNKATYTATYSRVNINPWSTSQIYRIEQFFTKTASEYTNVTPITVPSTRSRSEGAQFTIDPSVIKSVKLSAKPKE